MTCTQLLNSVGLVFGMVGVVILFKYGPPQPNLETGVGFGLEDKNVLANGRTVQEHNQDIKATKKHYSEMSKLGLALIFIGFACQLWATWI